MSETLKPERLRELLDYDAETGRFVWRPRGEKYWDNRYAGKAAGRPHPDGYIAIKVDKRSYFAHRLAWLYVSGSWPADKIEIDHKNRNRSDNRITNLRLATPSQNRVNSWRRPNLSGVRGVRWLKGAAKWQALIWPKGKSKSLGLFDDIERARAARIAAMRQLYGEFTVAQGSVLNRSHGSPTYAGKLVPLSRC